MEVKINVQLSAREMFSFLMQHTYSSFSGFIGVALSICAFMGLIYTRNNAAMTTPFRCVLVFTALLFTVIQPLNLYRKAQKQIKRNTSFAKPLTYTFDSRLMEVSQDDDRISFEWSDVTKVVSNKLVVIIYLGRTRAFVLPRKDIGDQFDNLKKLITTYSSATQIRMKKM